MPVTICLLFVLLLFVDYVLRCGSPMSSILSCMNATVIKSEEEDIDIYLG